MLEVYHRVGAGPVGERVRRRGISIIQPMMSTQLEGADPDYVADLTLIFDNMAYAVIGRFADGDLDIAEILPTLERAVYRLTADNERLVNTARRRPS